MTAYTILGILIVGLLELRPLIQKKKKRESVLVTIILTGTLITFVMNEFNMPSPLELVYRLISPMSKLIFKTM